MRRAVPTVAPDMSIEELVHEQLLRGEARAFAVLAGGELAGLITLTDVRKIPRDEWPLTSVYRAMTPASRLRTIEPGQCLTDVLQLMVQHDVNQLPVMRGRELAGMLDRADVMRYIQVRRELGEAEAERELEARQAGRQERSDRPEGASPRAS